MPDGDQGSVQGDHRPRRAETDPAKRAEIYEEFNQLYYETAPTIPLYVRTAAATSSAG